MIAGRRKAECFAKHAGNLEHTSKEAIGLKEPAVQQNSNLCVRIKKLDKGASSQVRYWPRWRKKAGQLQAPARQLLPPRLNVWSRNLFFLLFLLLFCSLRHSVWSKLALKEIPQSQTTVQNRTQASRNLLPMGFWKVTLLPHYHTGPGARRLQK